MLVVVNKRRARVGMTADEAEKSKISELKAHVYGSADAGGQAEEYMKMTKAIGEYVGRVYGKEMKSLVLHLKEGDPEEPDYPDSKGTEKHKAIWSKLYDRYLKKQEVYDDYKAKVFTVIMGQCTKVMKNEVEGTTGFAGIEAAYDVIALLKTIKRVAFGSNDMLYPQMQAAGALRQFVNVTQ